MAHLGVEGGGHRSRRARATGGRKGAEPLPQAGRRRDLTGLELSPRVLAGGLAAQAERVGGPAHDQQGESLGELGLRLVDAPQLDLEVRGQGQRHRLGDRPGVAEHGLVDDERLWSGQLDPVVLEHDSSSLMGKLH